MHISLDSALGRQRRLNSVGESVLQIAPDAAAAYSLRSLTGGDPDVVRVRRESDNTEKDFSGSQIESGEMARWVNEQPTLPLDLRELDTNTGERDGALIEAAAAYSLRKLKEDFTGDVVEVRRNVDGETEGFTAAEVTDGTLESFVNASFDDELPLDQATGAAAAYSLRNLSSSYTGNVVEVRRSSDDAVQSFTAAEVADGTLEDWVTPDALSGFYNNRAYFGAGNSGDYVRLLNVGNFGTQDWQWKLKFFLTDEPQFKGLISRNGQDPIIGVKANGQLQYYYEDINGNTQNSSLFPDGSINQLVEYTLTLDYDLSAKTMSVTLVGSDGTSVNGTLNNVYHNDAPAAINIGTNSNRTFSTGGSVYDVEIRQSGVLTNSYAGYGNTDADWLDLTGSINGEVFGSPELFTGQGINGHVRTWYDQSGSDNHAVQTTSANQPKIVDAGTLVTGGIDFDGAGQKLVTPTTSVLNIDGAKDKSIFAKGTFTATNFIFLGNIGASGEAIRYRSSGSNARFEVTGGGVSGGSVLGANGAVYSSIFSGTQLSDSDVSSNGSITDATGTLSINTANTVLDIGYLDGTLSEGAGQLSELIIYASDQSTKRRAIEENIANHYDITLAAFSRDGTVSTWYDQSGNTNDATQTDPAKQPKIVDGGNLVTGGIDFNGAEYLSRSSFTQGHLEQPNTIFSVAKMDSNDDTNRKVYDGKTGDGRNMLLLSPTDLGQFGIYSGSVLLTGDIATSDKHLFTALYNSTSSEFFIDGTSEASGDAGDYSMDAIVIGANHDKASNFWLGQIQEIIIYNSDQTDNRTAIEANIGETYGITDIPAANDTVNGYVQTWYDQSGNGNDAEQIAADKQPKIVDGGSLVTRNGDAAIKSTSDNEMTFTLDSLSADGQQSVFSVLENDVTSQDGFGLVFRVLSTSTSTGGVNRRPYWFVNPTGGLAFTVDSFTGYQNTDREYRLYSHIMNDDAGGTSTVHRDGTQVDTRSITLDANATFNEGRVLGVTTNATGALYMSEVIYYPSDQSSNRTAIETNIADEYGITLS